MNIWKFFLFTFLVVLFSCVLNNGKNMENKVPIETVEQDNLNLDECVDFVVLPYNNDYKYLFNDKWYEYLFRRRIPAELTVDDLKIINEILHDAVDTYNNEKKSSREENIVLENYKKTIYCDN